MSLKDYGHRMLRSLRRAIRARRLVFALGCAITAALVLVIVSITVYNVGGFYRYDLSRPGYEKERTEISKTAPDVSFDTTSPITSQTLQGMMDDLNEHSKNLGDYTTFDDTSLSDEDLELIQ